jgi:L-ascorbate metabolism protein UlaG (beta-lactamase superfamily)
VLVTHDHFDHLDVDRLVTASEADPSFVVFGPAAVACAPSARPRWRSRPGGVHGGGLAVRAVGGVHAEIYGGAPGTSNLGYLIDDGVYHPGNALHVPTNPVETLLVPACAPWLKLAEAIDFVRAVGPARTHPIHEAMLSDVGQASTDRWLGLKSGTENSRIPIGQTVTG